MRPICFVILGGSLFSAAVSADLEPAAVDMGPFSFIPTLTVSHGNDSNIFNQSSNEQSSALSIISPELQWLVQKDANTVALTYSGDYGYYTSSGNDDYTDHVLSLDGYFEMNSRNRFDLSANTKLLHDPRGTGSSEGAALTRGEPDEYKQDTLFGEWDFGAEGARFGARVNASAVDLEYRNNRLETQFRDRDETSVSGRLYGRVMPKTRFFVELEQSDIQYDTIPLNGNKLDSDQQATSIGIEWEITGRTSGSAKFGRTEKDFDSATLVDADINSWEIEVAYSVRTYSNLFFSSSRSPTETNGTGNFIDNRSHALLWVHDWSRKIGTTVSYGIGTDDFDGSPRSDDLTNYGLGINYKFDRWIEMNLTYGYEDKDSNDPVFDYDKRIITLSLNMSL